ncbi:MAG: hypothetical protein JWN67_1550 [Actinomycetia bacterium]|nr:hypothetical protein [Actinomycetes bacterium]
MPLDDTHLATDERDHLVRFLDYARATVVRKVQGVSDEDARQPRTDTGTSIGGLVKHLTWVERGWFRIRFLGEEVGGPSTDDDPDGDLRVEPGETMADLLADYARACDESRAVLAAHDLAEQTANPGLRGPVSLEWICFHMIEETARHAGHVDILREQLDGFVGD